MAEQKYDAIVIGAGPAGSSASRVLTAGGMRTLLIEKRQMPRHKICSGLLLFEGSLNYIIKKFGVMPENVYCQPNYLDGVALHFPSQANRNPVIVRSKEPMVNIWRSHFDHFLAGQSGAVIKDGLKMDNIEQVDGFKVICRRTQKGGKTVKVTFKSKYIVAADGNNSLSVRRFMPEAYKGLPKMKCLQTHYQGKIDMPRNYFNIFLYQNMGHYTFANIKDDHIVVGCAGFSKSKTGSYHSKMVSFLKDNYGLKIKKNILKEGMSGVIMAPLNRFVLGRGNFLVAGDAAGFLHSGGEGLSCAMSSGELAGEAILIAEKNSSDAYKAYSNIARDEVELCLDMFNPLKKLKTYPIFPLPMDLKSVWRKYSLKERYTMLKDIKAYGLQEYGFSDLDVARVIKKNIVYRLFHKHYPVNL